MSVHPSAAWDRATRSRSPARRRRSTDRQMSRLGLAIEIATDDYVTTAVGRERGNDVGQLVDKLRYRRHPRRPVDVYDGERRTWTSTAANAQQLCNSNVVGTVGVCWRDELRNLNFTYSGFVGRHSMSRCLNWVFETPMEMNSVTYLLTSLWFTYLVFINTSRNLWSLGHAYYTGMVVIEVVGSIIMNRLLWLY